MPFTAPDPYYYVPLERIKDDIRATRASDNVLDEDIEVSSAAAGESINAWCHRTFEVRSGTRTFTVPYAPQFYADVDGITTLTLWGVALVVDTDYTIQQRTDETGQPQAAVLTRLSNGLPTYWATPADSERRVGGLVIEATAHGFPYCPASVARSARVLALQDRVAGLNLYQKEMAGTPQLGITKRATSLIQDNLMVQGWLAPWVLVQDDMTVGADGQPISPWGGPVGGDLRTTESISPPYGWPNAGAARYSGTPYRRGWR